MTNENYEDQIMDLYPIENSLLIKSAIKQSELIKINIELTLNKNKYTRNIKRYNRKNRLKALRNYYYSHRDQILKRQKEKRNGF